MKNPFPHLGLTVGKGQEWKRGSALLITLAFVILLTVLIVGFLSRSLLEERISSSSANQVRSDLFTGGVEATIIGDLEQEIINNSNPSTPATGVTIYVPKTAANMVPLYDYPGCPTSTTGPAATLANLLKVSTTAPASGSTFPPAASALTTAASINGRSVSLARWAESAMVDPTAIPLPTSPPPTWTPNWIMVARDGTNPTTFSNSGASDVTLQQSGKTNAKTIVGRFAYAIYDEGGLLDMNVAGQPSTLASAPAPYSYAAAYRNGQTFADLTQIGLNAVQIDSLLAWRNGASLSLASSAVYPPATLTVSTGSSGALSIANTTNYVGNLQNQVSGNLMTANPSVVNNGTTYNTDQKFTSRTELIQFMQGLLGTATGNTALQYMSHFSRGLSQPSFAPDPSTSRPKTTASNGSDGFYYASNYNSAAGDDNNINPSFLSVRVSAAFTRNDGTPAYVGDPLVKKTFNLNRLAWLTYLGPICDGHYTSGIATSAAQINSNATIQIIVKQLVNYYGFSYAFLQQGTAGNIYNYFGLSWVKDDPSIRTKPVGDGQMKWFYDHQLANVSSTATTSPYTTLPTLNSTNCAGIQRLKDIAALTGTSAREPDFVELMKGAIVVGSKAKTATIPSNPGNYTPINQSTAPAAPLATTTPQAITPTMPENVYSQSETSVSFHLIQLFANIMDQYQLDGYPARIIYCDGSLIPPREYCGVENLPYIYRVRPAMVENTPYAGTGASSAVVNPASTGTYSPIITASTTAGGTGVVSTPGAYACMVFPEIWNPHDQNSPRCAIDPSTSTYLKDAGGNPMFPTSFQIVADSVDPDDIQPPSNLATIKANYYDVSGVVQQGSVSCNTQVSGTVYPTMAPWPSGATGSTAIGFSTYLFPLFSGNSALTFTINESSAASAVGFFREPTVLMSPTPAWNLRPSGANNYLLPAATSYSTAIPGGQDAITYPALDYSSANPNVTGTNYKDTTYGGIKGSDGNTYLGFYLGTTPGAWLNNAGTTTNPITGATTAVPVSCFFGGYMDSRDYHGSQYGSTSVQYGTGVNAGNGFAATLADSNLVTYRLQYFNSYDPNSTGWSTYDTKYTLSGCRNTNNPIGSPSLYLFNGQEYSECYDPRTSRFAFAHGTSLIAPGTQSNNGSNNASNNKTTSQVYGWLDTTGHVVVSNRPDYSNGFWTSAMAGPKNDPASCTPEAYGWATSGEGQTANVSMMGMTAQNDPDWTPNGKATTSTTPAAPTYFYPIATTPNGAHPQFYADPDQVVRRGTAAYASAVVSATSSLGLPTATANSGYSTGVPSTTPTDLSGVNHPIQNRPIILHRPFTSVAELGYVFSGTPWKNLDFFTPESGDDVLLDVFSVGDTTDTGGLVAGKVNLNTQQIPVLQAVLAGAYADEQKIHSTSTAPTWAVPTLTTAESAAIASALTKRTLSSNTSASQGPLRNLSELVGKYVSNVIVLDPNNSSFGPYPGYIDGSKSYSGLVGDAAYTSAFTTNSDNTSPYLQRLRESAIRTLAASGQTRVWNLMIDVVAQTGNYPPSSSTWDQFAVQGEQRYWVHLAIDRLTGQVIDKQIETIKE